MSSPFAQQQISPPADWQAFERVSAVLWGEILDDPLLSRFGRLGQQQHGLDLTGYRNGQPGQLIGIQCKCISRFGKLTKAIVLAEVGKVARYTPPLSEFVLTTTADDDAALHQFAHELTDDFLNVGRKFIIRIWGWNTLVDQLHCYPKALHALDPTAAPFAQKLAKAVDQVTQGQAEIVQRLESSRLESGLTFSEFHRTLVSIKAALPTPPDFEASDNAELDRYKKLLNEGQPRTALGLIREKENQLDAGATSNIRSRLRMLAGYCCWHLGDTEEAAVLFTQAAALVPGERRGVAATVLASFVRGDYNAAYRGAVEALEIDQENDAVIPWLIAAAAHIPDARDPLDIVPSALQSSVQFAEGYVQYLRGREAAPVWWAYARESSVAHPSSSILATSAADAELDEFTNTTDFSTSNLVPDEWRSRLASAVEVHEAELGDIAASEIPCNPAVPGISCNLAGMLYVLGRQHEAKVVLTTALARFPNDMGLLLRTAQMALETRDKALQFDCLSKLGSEPSHLLVRVLILARHGRWEELADLASANDFGAIPGHDGALALILSQLAAIRRMPIDDARSAIRELASDPRVRDDQLAVVVDIASEFGLSAEAEAIYTRAKEAIGLGTHIAARLNFAFTAERREDWAAITHILDGKIDQAADSPELRLLAHAHANRTPVSKAAIDFFDSLPPAVRALPTYLELAAFTLLRAGAAKHALTTIEAAIQLRPRSARLILWKGRALAQIGRGEAAAQFMGEVEPSSLEGAAVDRLHVAHLLAQYGRRAEAISFGHSIVVENIGNAQAELLYCGLILNFADDAPGLPPTPTVVRDQTWVRLRDQHNHADEFIIDSKQIQSASVVWPSEERSRRVMGLAVGDTIRSTNGGFERISTLEQIKHVYLHTLHFILHSFNDRHPGHTGLWQVPVQGDDVSPILEMMKRRADDGERISEYYERQAVPLEFVALGAGADTLGFMEHLEEREFGIRTCVGTSDERASAIAAITSTECEAVLDITALWTALRLDAIPVLRVVFRKLIIAESTYIVLKERHEELVNQAGRGGGTLGYRNGRFWMMPFDHPLVSQARDQIAAYLDILERDFERVSAVAPEGLEDDWVRLLSREGSEHLADSVFVGIEHRSVLISEDLNYRKFASELGLVTSSWLQPVFAHALDLGHITPKAYATFVLSLAELKHGFVTFNAEALAEIATAAPARFDAAAKYIGGPNAELKSHIGVVSGFSDLVLHKNHKSLRRALSALLERVRAVRPKDWEKCMAALVLRAKRPSQIQAYISGWCSNRNLKTRGFFRVLMQTRKTLAGSAKRKQGG